VKRPEIVTRFHKSTYSGQGGECVEVAQAATWGCAVRDSKNPDGPTLAFSVDAWAAFIADVKAGEFPGI
jgi:hypothetical protein